MNLLQFPARVGAGRAAALILFIAARVSFLANMVSPGFSSRRTRRTRAACAR